MDIKNLNSIVANTRQAETGRKAEKTGEQAPASSASTQASPAEDKVTINRLSAEAAQAEKANDTPEQSEKVQRLKQAIAEGTYEVDTKAVAKKLMQTEALFSTL